MQYPDQSPSDEQNKIEHALGLSAQDIEAVDRIFVSDPETFIAESDRDHAVLNLFNLLDSPVGSEIQRTSRLDLIQILAARLRSSSQSTDAQLSIADQRALDQYVEQGYQIDGVDMDLQDRAEKCAQIGDVITANDGQGESDLVGRTLGLIQTHIDAEEAAMNTRSTGGGFSIRLSDIISIAATLLLVASVTLPIMSGIRFNAQKGLCFDNMHTSANAFGLYAGSNRDMLPMATAGFGSTWMDVGSTPERSNSSNLYMLVRTNAANLDDLACPSNPNAATGQADPDAKDWQSLEEISYSYPIMPPGGIRASAVKQPVSIVLLADRSPVILRVARGQLIIPEENSPNHNSTGQHLLMLDGASKWTRSPVINDHDNIWLPRPVEKFISQERTRLGIIKGSEMPDGPTDAFVGP